MKHLMLNSDDVGFINKNNHKYITALECNYDENINNVSIKHCINYKIHNVFVLTINCPINHSINMFATKTKQNQHNN